MVFTIVETELSPPLTWRDRLPWRRSAGYELGDIDSPRCTRLLVEMPLGAREEELRRRAEAGFAAAAARGSAGVVLPDGFPFPELAPRAGLAVSTPVPLFRRLAARIVLFCAERSESARTLRVALIAGRATPELISAAEALCPAAKTLNVWAGRDSDALCDALRYERGVPALAQRQPEADIYVFFQNPGFAVSIPENSLILNFSGCIPTVLGGTMADGALLEPPAALRSGWPHGCDGPCLMAAMAASGALALTDIRITGLSMLGRPLRWGS